MVLPSGFTSKISKIDTFDGEIEQAYPPLSVTFLLEDDIDISRGDMLVRTNNKPEISQDIEVMLCWFDHSKPLQEKGKYILKHTTQDAKCMIKEIRYKLDINSLHRETEDKEIKSNDIARVVIRTTKPIFFDSYRKNRSTGSIILVDEGSNNTVAAGMIR
jgi:sulfate adenylyltransferase subunit 1